MSLKSLRRNNYLHTECYPSNAVYLFPSFYSQSYLNQLAVFACLHVTKLGLCNKYGLLDSESDKFVHVNGGPHCTCPIQVIWSSKSTKV